MPDTRSKTKKAGEASKQVVLNGEEPIHETNGQTRSQVSGSDRSEALRQFLEIPHRVGEQEVNQSLRRETISQRSSEAGESLKRVHSDGHRSASKHPSESSDKLSLVSSRQRLIDLEIEAKVRRAR